MKRILVLGSTGMAGHVITTYLEKNPKLEIYNLSHTRKLNNKSIIMDVMNIEELNKYLNKIKVDFIINCIGILNKYAEMYMDKAAFLNGYLPHFLEYKYKNSDTRIIHLSTDCVFSGKDGNYTENSFRDGDSFYDRTKTVGEIINNKDITFRTSIIGPDMNPDGIGLFNWYMRNKGEINGYVNAIWTGVTTIELAKAIECAIFSDLTGLYHLVSDTSINKYELLSLFSLIFSRKDLIINECEDIRVNKSLINTRTDFSHRVPTYYQMINEMKKWIDENKMLYPHYIIN
ncbi:sugar nucleotide-binding protein [Brassicibacter mesophilus]|uniref:sugar nucleotide-binding protein n=1 Tax=Brassicibacter mesophilus TaxID=745119 RepID=UPI003D25AAB2